MSSVRLSTWRSAGACTALIFISACGSTGREHTEIELFAQGTKARSVDVSGGSLNLEEAEVAVGPLYLCATESAESELCESALGEFLETKTFDALNPRAEFLGTLPATTGTVRGGFFDYGISWLLTKAKPRANEGAVDGHSAKLVFVALRESGEMLRVTARLDVAPRGPGDAAVNGQRALHKLTKDSARLTLSVNPNSWLRRIRLSDLFALDEDADGVLELPSDSQAYTAIVLGMTANAPPILNFE